MRGFSTNLAGAQADALSLLVPTDLPETESENFEGFFGRKLSDFMGNTKIE